MSSVCRICLAGNTRQYEVKNNLLLNLYEKLSNTKFNHDDARPRALCCFCYQKLLRCHTFSQMALRSEKIFSHLYDSSLQVVTHEYITDVNLFFVNKGHHLNIKQHLSLATMQSINIDDNTTKAVSQVTIKGEPSIDIKEEVITEPDKLLDVESLPDHSIKSRLTFEEDYSDQENNVEELLSNTDIDQSKPDGSSFTIKVEPLPSIDVKEEVTTEDDQLAEIGSIHELSTKSRLRFEEDYNDQVKDLGNLHYKAVYSKTTFSCNNCNKIFDMKRKLISHIRNSHSQINHMRAQQFNRKVRLEQHKLKHDGSKPPYICEVCGAHYKHKRAFDIHIALHKGISDWKCEECNKLFGSKNALQRHNNIHTGKLNYQCDLCGKTFIHRTSFKMHKLSHSGIKPHVCDVCGLALLSSSHLKRHKRIHNGEKCHKCSICGKRFSERYNLAAHAKSHEAAPASAAPPPTGDAAPRRRSFRCHFCKEGFERRHMLERHMAVQHGRTLERLPFTRRNTMNKLRWAQAQARHSAPALQEGGSKDSGAEAGAPGPAAASSKLLAQLTT